MAVWPVTLPDDFLLAAYSETAPDNIISSEMEIGPPKTRRRSTSATRKISGNIILTTAQVATHDTFFTTTLYDGAEPFDWTNQRTGSTVEVMYVPHSPPVYTPLGNGKWNVAINLMITP